MRTIKFRFYNKKRKAMIYWPDSEGRAIITAGTLRENETWKVMQYTGLLDKNGKEIYEGDIIKGDLYFTKPSEVELPVFFYEMYEYHGGFNGENIEVIGNIYENPELLKGETS